MLKILFWSNEKWRDEEPNRLVRRLEPAGGHFIPSQMAAHDANSGSGPNSRHVLRVINVQNPQARHAGYEPQRPAALFVFQDVLKGRRVFLPVLCYCNLAVAKNQVNAPFVKGLQCCIIIHVDSYVLRFTGPRSSPSAAPFLCPWCYLPEPSRARLSFAEARHDPGRSPCRFARAVSQYLLLHLGHIFGLFVSRRQA